MFNSNFSFLYNIYPNVAENLIKAEKYYAKYDDTVIVLGYLRRALIDIANFTIIHEQINFALNSDLNTKLRELKFNNCIPSNILNLMHGVRKERNKVYYDNKDSNTLFYIISMFAISKWFYYKYEGLTDYPEEFTDPKLIYDQVENKEELQFKKDSDNTNQSYGTNVNALVEFQRKAVKRHIDNKVVIARAYRSEQIIGQLLPVISYCDEYLNYIFEDKEAYENKKTQIDEKAIIIDLSPEADNTEVKPNSKTSFTMLIIILIVITVGFTTYVVNTTYNQKQMLSIMSEVIQNNKTPFQPENNEYIATNNENEDSIIDVAPSSEVTDTNELNQEKDKFEDMEVALDVPDNDGDEKSNIEEQVEDSRQELEVNDDSESKIDSGMEVHESVIDEPIEVTKNEPVEVKSKAKINILNVDKPSPQDEGTNIIIQAYTTSNEVIYKFEARNIESDKWNNLGYGKESSVSWIPETAGEYFIKTSIFDEQNNFLDDITIDFVINEKSSGWLYFINDNNKIYKMDTNGNNLVKLNSVNAFNLEIYKDWLYFYSMDDKYIYKMDVNSQDVVRVTAECYPPKFRDNEVKSFVIYDDYLYYLTDSKNMNRINLKNNNNEEVINTDRGISFFDVDSRYVYLVFGVDFAVYDIDNGKGESLEQAQNWTNIKVYDGFAYYVFADNSIGKIKKDGSISSSLGSGSNQFLIEDGCVYSINNSYPGYGHLIKYDINGNDELNLCKDSVQAINVEGDWVYFSTGYDFRKIKSNGHNETVITEISAKEIIVQNFQ